MSQPPENWYANLIEAINNSAKVTQDSIRQEIHLKFDEVSNKIGAQEDKLKVLERQHKKLDLRSLEHERRIRKNNILIFGLKTQLEHESILASVLKLLKDKLDVELSESDINNIYSISNNNPNKPPSIKVEFISFLKKLTVIKNCYKLKNTNIFIAQDLCVEDREERKILVEQLRLARTKGLNAKIRGNKLLVNDEEYSATDLQAMNNEDEQEKIAESTQSNSAPPTPSARRNLNGDFTLLSDEKTNNLETAAVPDQKSEEFKNCSETKNNAAPTIRSDNKIYSNQKKRDAPTTPAKQSPKKQKLQFNLRSKNSAAK